MITIIQTKPIKPIEVFIKFYNEALNSKQKNIEAICISSYDVKSSQVESRFVNLKYIKGNQWLFFSGYNGPKSIQFDSHPQISGLFYWPSINVQIRIKATIKKTSDKFNQEYFFSRSEEKNALAISSKQSTRIDTFDEVEENFKKSLKHDDLKTCPKYWGGYTFLPYEFEFWEGNKFRLNKRNLYIKNSTAWDHFILEP